jgi:hypothetical protein
MKSLITIAVLLAVGLGAAPAQSAAWSRSGDRAAVVYSTSTLVSHRCGDYRRYPRWSGPHVSHYGWFGYGHKSGHGHKYWRKHHGRYGKHPKQFKHYGHRPYYR